MIYNAKLITEQLTLARDGDDKHFLSGIFLIPPTRDFNYVWFCPPVLRHFPSSGNQHVQVVDLCGRVGHVALQPGVAELAAKARRLKKMHPSQTFTSFETNIMRAYTETDLRFRVGLHRVDKRGDYNFQNVFPSASSE